MEQTAGAEVRERGEVTIPKKIREAFHLEAGQKVEFIPIGKSAVLMTPKRLELEEARRLIRGIMKQAKVSPEEILRGLETSREDVFRERYGKKSHGK